MDADALVIGGGAAGMAAARALARRSARVILLEARDRLGGRVWPRAGPRGDAPADLGGEFIHGKAPHTFALLREAGLRAVSAGGDAWMSSGGAVERIDPDRMTFAGVFHATRSLTHDESIDSFLRRFDADPKMRDRANAARAFVEGFDAADPAIASACAIADEWRSGVDTTIARPIGGYGPMFDYLREACTAAGVQTRLSTPVRRISWRPGSVAAEVTAASGAALTLEARCAVVTVPVGVLRESDDLTGLAFVPDLPPAKRRALSRIEMGHAVKVALWFKTAFWERLEGGRYRNAEFLRAEGQALPTYWTQLPERSTLVIAWAGGPRAVALGGLSHAERYERALDGLAAFFGEAAVRAELEDAATHDWSSDPFSRGAYSYVAVGGATARSVLAAPVDATLFFAGEATSTDGNGGTVNGALETGERAAAQAASALAGKMR